MSHPHRLARAVPALVLLTTVAACARPIPPLRASPEASRASLPTAPVGPLAFDAAVRLLVQRHPELVAVRAEAAAIDPDPSRVRLDAEAGVRDGELADLGLGAEVLSLLGVGPRSARMALARALRDELRLQHHERARALVGALAEAYAVDAELAGLPTLPAAPDLARWQEAGLVSDAIAEAAAGVAEGLEVEAALRAIEIRRTREAISTLVGSAPDDRVVPVLPEAPWPPPPAAEAAADAVVLARGDVLRRVAAVQVAERALRLAAQEQWPDIVVRLGVGLDPTTPLQTIGLSLPLDAPHKVEVARRQRAAAARRLDEAVHGALADAAGMARDAETADAGVRGVQADLRTIDAVLRAEAARLDTTAEALGSWIDVQGRRVFLLRQLREARVDAARRRVRASVAAGWPGPAIVEVLR